MAECKYEEEYHKTASVVSVKGDKPYPFRNICKELLRCKIVLKWSGMEEDGYEEEYRYVAYAIDDFTQCFDKDRNPISCCKQVNPGDRVYVHVESKKRTNEKGRILILRMKDYE